MRDVERTFPLRPFSVVARPALFERLSAGYARGVVLVSAPAGSGKTVLLRSWIDAADLADRTAWISIDREERDAQHFWLSIVEALRAVAGIEGPIEDLGPAPGFNGEGVVERVVAGSLSLDEPLLLVLDDLHNLLDPSALAQLEILLARRPPQLRVILAARHDPSLGLHRFRLAGELTEVRASDLRFQLHETNQLLSAAGVGLSAAGVDSLLARTEGWAAGLRLAALSLAGDPEPERFVAEFSGSERTVADYLFAEVVQRQPEPVRQLLLRTSILERVNGSLADRLLGTSGSEAILLELADAGAFVYAIDRERSWFRYHNLFADLLRLELRRSEPAAVLKLHRAASEWYAERGQAVDAIRHAQAANDWRLAGNLLGQHGFSITLDGSFATMRSLLAAFPADAFENPVLAAFLAYGEVIRPSLETAAAYVAVAERHASEVPEGQRAAFTAMLATARLALARWRGDYAMALREVQPLLEPGDVVSVGEIALGNDLRATALLTIGIVELWAGAGDEAERHLTEAAQLAHRIGRPYVEQGCLAHLAVAAGRHSMEQARDLASRAFSLLERYGWLSEPVAPLVFATLGGLDVVQGRFAEAQPWLDRAEQAIRSDTEPAKELFVRYARATQRLGQGHLAEANALFAEAQRVQGFLVDPDPLAIASRGFQVQTLVRLGDIPAARAALDTASDAEREYAETRIALAAICTAERDARGALDALAPVLAGATRIILPYMLPNAIMVDAIAQETLGDSRAAENDVERALELAEPQALILPFLVTPARGLLERHPRHRTAHAALLANVLDVLRGATLSTRREPLELADALTDSEIRVLRYLPSNLSAPEIATEIFLSTSTVKTHTRHIYEKLGAHTRTEAVDRARELGLLGPSSHGRR